MCCMARKTNEGLPTVCYHVAWWWFMPPCNWWASDTSLHCSLHQRANPTTRPPDHCYSCRCKSLVCLLSDIRELRLMHIATTSARQL